MNMVKYEQFENVWDAIETDPVVAASLKARSSVMMAIEQTVKSWRISQVTAAKRLGVTQPRLNDLLRGRINKFSLDALMAIAAKAGLSIELKIKKAA
jgi:predicted XRE-type DNA-binding protein